MASRSLEKAGVNGYQWELLTGDKWMKDGGVWSLILPAPGHTGRQCFRHGIFSCFVKDPPSIGNMGFHSQNGTLADSGSMIPSTRSSLDSNHFPLSQ